MAEYPEYAVKFNHIVGFLIQNGVSALYNDEEFGASQTHLLPIDNETALQLVTSAVGPDGVNPMFSLSVLDMKTGEPVDLCRLSIEDEQLVFVDPVSGAEVSYPSKIVTSGRLALDHMKQWEHFEHAYDALLP